MIHKTLLILDKFIWVEKKSAGLLLDIFVRET
jgi:hypothetical protein